MEQKERPLNKDVIKYIAMFTMLLNHIAGVFFAAGTLLYEILTDIGYFTAITMCYFLVEGYQFTKSKKNYGLRLFGFACISQIPYMLVFKNGESKLNMIYTLFICFLILITREKVKNRFLCIIIEFGLVLATLKADWFIFAPVFVIMCDTWKSNKKKIWYAYYILTAAFGTLMFVSYLDLKSVPLALLCAVGSCAGIMISGIVIQFFYNGKRAEHGKTFSKWFFYLFYPIHLLILSFFIDL